MFGTSSLCVCVRARARVWRACDFGHTGLGARGLGVMLFGCDAASPLEFPRMWRFKCFGCKEAYAQKCSSSPFEREPIGF